MGGWVNFVNDDPRLAALHKRDKEGLGDLNAFPEYSNRSFIGEPSK